MKLHVLTSRGRDLEQALLLAGELRASVEEPEDDAVTVCDESCWRYVPGGPECGCYDGGVWGPGC